MACCMAGMWQCVPQPLPSSISTPFIQQLTCQIQLLLPLLFSSSSSACCCLWAGSCAGVDRVLKYYRASRFCRICWGMNLSLSSNAKNNMHNFPTAWTNNNSNKCRRISISWQDQSNIKLISCITQWCKRRAAAAGEERRRSLETGTRRLRQRCEMRCDARCDAMRLNYSSNWQRVTAKTGWELHSSWERFCS